MIYYYNLQSKLPSFSIYEKKQENILNNHVEITENQYQEIIEKLQQGFDISYVNGAFNFTKHIQNKSNEEILNELRIKREPLLIAFDKYKTNVSYGTILETNDIHIEILKWYDAILNLDENAINTIPKSIEYFIV